MFVGHLGVALAARKADRAPSLVWLMTAANFVDLVWPLFLLLGLERVRIDPGNTAFTPLAFESYPWTHSLLMGIVWGIALAALARWRGVAKTGAWIVGGLVVSHWLLDFVTHRPDLPLWPWSDRVYGLGLWHSIPATFVVEGLLWLIAIGLFLSARRPRGLHGQLALWSFVLVSTLPWVSSPFETPPSDARALAMFSLFGWIIVPWAWWIERTSDHR